MKKAFTFNIKHMWLTYVLNFMPNKHSQGYFTGASTFLQVKPFLQTNLMTPHVFLSAPEKWPGPCSFGLKLSTHVSHIYWRLNVEAFSSTPLDCRDKWWFHIFYKFPISCPPSCLPFQCRHLKWSIFPIYGHLPIVYMFSSFFIYI